MRFLLGLIYKSGGVSTGSVVCSDVTSSGTVSALQLFASNTLISEERKREKTILHASEGRRILSSCGDRIIENASSIFFFARASELICALAQGSCRGAPPAARSILSQQWIKVDKSTSLFRGGFLHGLFHLAFGLDPFFSLPCAETQLRLRAAF